MRYLCLKVDRLTLLSPWPLENNQEVFVAAGLRREPFDRLKALSSSRGSVEGFSVRYLGLPLHSLKTAPVWAD